MTIVTRNWARNAAFIVLLNCLLGARVNHAHDEVQQPNIVFILVDDLRHDTFSHLRHPFVETPSIDLLVDEGLRFANAFVTTSLCSPARASFLTGQYMHHHKVVGNADLMPSGTVTFPQLLKGNNYRTAFIGKWHMGGSSDAPRPGFEHWVSFRGQGTYAPDRQSLNVNGEQVPRTKYMTDELTDYAVDWLDKQSTDAPFLLYLAHKGVHGLYDPAPRHVDRYRDQPFRKPPTFALGKKELTKKPMWVQDQRNSWHGVEFPYHGRAKQSVAEMYNHYCEMILSIDESVGRVLEVLQRNDLDRNTLIVFTSDGGHLWGEQGLIDKRCAYEASIRIPLIMRYPEFIKANILCQATVANIDIAPTILELAGIPLVDSMDGQSLVRLIQQPEELAGWRSALLYEYYWEPSFPQTPTLFSLRTDRYKLIQQHGLYDIDELYDLVEDPDEQFNLILDDQHQERVRAMRAELHARLRETDGLVIPLSTKRNHGSHLRSPQGSQRAEFPESFYPKDVGVSR